MVARELAHPGALYGPREIDAAPSDEAEFGQLAHRQNATGRFRPTSFLGFRRLGMADVPSAFHSQLRTGPVLG